MQSRVPFPPGREHSGFINPGSCGEEGLKWPHDLSQASSLAVLEEKKKKEKNNEEQKEFSVSLIAITKFSESHSVL